MPLQITSQILSKQEQTETQQHRGWIERYMKRLPANFQTELLEVLVAKKKKASTFLTSEDKQHREWLFKAVVRMQTIKPGNTRADLFKVFTGEGGLSANTQCAYVYRTCPYIKVMVHFRLANKAKYEEDPKDIIVKISKPYLQWSIMD
jgi:transcription elongation factor GreA-like protein